MQEDENNFKSFLVCFPLKYTPLNNPFYNLLKIKTWGGRAEGVLVINLPTEEVSFLYSRPTFAISKSF